MAESEGRRGLPDRVSLILSDVDGTLVTGDKQLTPRAIAAARAIRGKTIRFTVASSRPPFGLRSIVDALDLDLPTASFNGGLISAPTGEVLAAHWIARDLAAAVIEFFEERSVDVWAFTAQEWLCRDPNGAYVAQERRTVSQEASVVSSFDPYLDRLGKIVAVSTDPDRLALCESAAQARFGDKAMVARSQSYYLDVTHPKANKANALKMIAASLGIPLSECVAIGDGGNDLGMVRAAGYGVAMSNGVDTLRAQADFVTASNNDDGFARAVDHILEGVGEGIDRRSIR